MGSYAIDTTPEPAARAKYWEREHQVATRLGRCLACGSKRDSDVADDMAFTDALRQHDHE